MLNEFTIQLGDREYTVRRGVDGKFVMPAELLQHRGLGTSLKPAFEPIILCRKPLDGTIAENVLKWGTGALNIQASRVGDEDTRSPTYAMTSKGLNGQGFGTGAMDYERSGEMAGSESGRWPANVLYSVPEDEFELRGDLSAEQRQQVYRWLHENT